jgi:hypothetical protein
MSRCQWVPLPPPPPPPSGHFTLGPKELRAVAACRRLRRLQLDVSLRSAALAVAAVQLIAQSCIDLEVCCVTPSSSQTVMAASMVFIWQ